MASILVNGFKEQTHNCLLIDEAMMNLFGAIITAALLAKAKELLLIGYINQIPHVDRHNVFPMNCEKPNTVAKSPENCYDLTETPDAIERLIQRASNATTERIIEYNAKMAIRSRDINSVTEITKHRKKPEQC
ncbi:hypothetical protein EVAR_8228_1 [Eumeta japonica]|uniref:Uncharacterized protein n=1 Tax=Eumeta variegata TaxID=151549 RepID=A0A4C1TI99_EUMVA|nr:hypothetical protein EVAR_8228_1 [Eumeta japonica]